MSGTGTEKGLLRTVQVGDEFEGMYDSDILKQQDIDISQSVFNRDFMDGLNI